MERVLGLFLYVVELHANNTIVVYSDALTSQIPLSFAANAFLVFQRSMHQIEIVRLCALWDKPEIEKENIPTVVRLIDDAKVIEALVQEARNQYGGSPTDTKLTPIEREDMQYINRQLGEEYATRAQSDISAAIDDAKAVLRSNQLKSVMNVRNKHLAHSLETTHAEKHSPIRPMKYGDETELLKKSIPVVERLYCWVNGRSFSIKNSEQIDQNNAEALWGGCKFNVLR